MKSSFTQGKKRGATDSARRCSTSFQPAEAWRGERSNVFPACSIDQQSIDSGKLASQNLFGELLTMKRTLVNHALAKRCIAKNALQGIGKRTIIERGNIQAFGGSCFGKTASPAGDHRYPACKGLGNGQTQTFEH